MKIPLNEKAKMMDKCALISLNIESGRLPQWVGFSAIIFNFIEESQTSAIVALAPFEMRKQWGSVVMM
jgi:hypothetical protein